MRFTMTYIQTAMPRYFKRVLMLVLLAGCGLWGERVQAQVPGSENDFFRVEPSSRIWVEGSTTINDFSCVDHKVGGFGQIIGDSLLDRTVTDSSRTQVVVRLNVSDLDCGRRRMNRDMYHAMKADSFPRISYHLLSARMLSLPHDINGDFKAETIGTISLAGKSQVIKMAVDGVLLPNGRFHVTGSHPLLMSDFGIHPPSPFWGLIKTKDRIVVHFDLYVTPAASKPQSD